MPIYIPPADPATNIPDTRFGEFGRGAGSALAGLGDLFSGIADVKEGKKNKKDKQDIDDALKSDPMYGYNKAKEILGIPEPPAPVPNIPGPLRLTGNVPRGTMPGAPAPQPGVGSLLGNAMPPGPPPMAPGAGPTNPIPNRLQNMPLNANKLQMLQKALGEKGFNQTFFPQQPKPAAAGGGQAVFLNVKTGDIKPTQPMDASAVDYKQVPLTVARAVAQQIQQKRIMQRQDENIKRVEGDKYKTNTVKINEKYGDRISKMDAALKTIDQQTASPNPDKDKVLQQLQDLQRLGVVDKSVQDQFTGWFTSKGDVHRNLVALRSTLLNAKHQVEKQKGMELGELTSAYTISKQNKIAEFETKLMMAAQGNPDITPDIIAQEKSDYAKDLGVEEEQ